jgi:hypothetical protein
MSYECHTHHARIQKYMLCEREKEY